MRYQYRPTEAKIKKNGTNECGEDVEQWKLSHTAGGSVK